MSEEETIIRHLENVAKDLDKMWGQSDNVSAIRRAIKKIQEISELTNKALGDIEDIKTGIKELKQELRNK